MQPFSVRGLDRRGMQGCDMVGNRRDFARLDEAGFKEVDLNAALRSTVEMARYELTPATVSCSWRR